MNAYVNSLAGYLLAQSWQIALLAAIVALISLALRNRSAHIRYLLWLIVLAKCIVPPVYSVPVPVLPDRPLIEQLPPPATPEIQVVDVAVKASAPIEIEATVESEESKRVLPSLKETAVLVWSLGTFMFLVWVGIRAVRYTLWLRRRRMPVPSGLHQAFEELFAGFKLKKQPRVWLTRDIGQPFVWGLLRGSVYLPVDFLALNDPERCRTILAHELSHVVRFDAAINLLQVLAQGIYWFHPFVWWMNRKIRQEREKCCDEMTVAQFGPSPEHYTDVIVEALAAERRSACPIPSLAIVGSLKDIEERIKTMMKPGKKFYERPSFGIAVVVLCLAFLIVPVGYSLTSREKTETATAPEKTLPISLNQAAENGDLALVKKLIADGADVNGTVKVGAGQKVELTPLIKAASGGHTQVVKVLLENGAKVDTTCSVGFSALYYAIWSAGINDVEGTIKVLIANGADVNKHVQEDGYSPLIHAIWMFVDKEDVVKALLDAGADIDFKDKDGLTPLYWAAFSSGKDVLDLILARGNYGNTIHLAACRGNISHVTKCVEEGTDVDVKDEFGCTPLQWAALAETTTVADFLLDKGANINAKGPGDLTPLIAARGFPMIKLLVSKGADVQAQSGVHGMTKLHLACTEKDKEVVEFLISKGAQINHQNRRGLTPLWLASTFGHTEIVELLIEKGAEIDMANNKGATPLWIASRNGSRETVELLISRGADINKERTPDGFTPLHAVCNNGHLEIVGLLLEKGADFNAKTNNGDTPLSLAEKSGHTEIVELLRKHGATDDSSAGADDAKPTKSLHQAAAEGDIEQVKLLISKGADVNAENETRQTSLHIAGARGRSEIAELLISNGADINAKSVDGRTPADVAMDLNRKGTARVIMSKSKGKPLHVAAYLGDLERVRNIIRSDTDINAKDENGQTALHYAARHRHKDVVALLLANGAHVDEKNSAGETPACIAINGKGWSWWSGAVDLLIERGADISSVQLAAYTGDLRRVKDFLERGTSVNSATPTGFTALHMAAIAGRKEIAEFLISKGANVNADQEEMTPLCCAALHGHKGVVELLISKGADMADGPDVFCTPLDWAVIRGHEHVVELLIAKGADVNALGEDDVTPLHYAVAAKNVDMARLLINSGATVDLKIQGGCTPLHWATHKGPKELVELLIVKGADVNARDSQGRTPLLHAKEHGQPEIAELLRKHGAKDDSSAGTDDAKPAKSLHQAAADGDIEQVKLCIQEGTDINARAAYGGATALHRAAGEGRKAIVQLLIDRGADVNARDDSGSTPLHVAAAGHVDALRVLISSGADVNAKNLRGGTPLIIAVAVGNSQVIKILMDQGANPHAKNSRGFTPINGAMTYPKGSRRAVDLLIRGGAKVPALNLAAYRGDTETVKKLLKDGTRVDSRGDSASTALHAAAGGGSLQAARLLIAGGANVNAKGNTARTPLHVAAALGHVDLTEFLIAEGADVGAKGRYGRTALHDAALEGHTKVVDLLIARGADVNAKDPDGFTPLHLAAMSNRKDVAELLIANGADLSAEDRAEWRSLHRAVNRGHKQMAEFLIAKGSDVNAKGPKNRRTPLYFAVRGGHEALVELLVTKGADDFGRFKSMVFVAMKQFDEATVKRLLEKSAGASSMHLAAYAGDGEHVNTLIKEGMDVNIEDRLGYRALHYATGADRREVVELLIARGADVNAGEWTPLHVAVQTGRTAIAECLIDAGANVRAGKWTPLKEATWGNNTDLVELLITKGADVNAGALHKAVGTGQTATVELLIARGANINGKDGMGRTPLHIATSEAPHLVKLLISKGADVHMKDEEGRAPLSIASDKGHTEIVELLRKHGAEE